MSTASIVYANEKYFPSFHAALAVVAAEKIFLEMIEAPSLEKVASFQRELTQKNGPTFYAISNDQVVGWCDIFPKQNPRQSHRGSLGMGILPAFRGQGIGSKLLEQVLTKAKEFGLEKVELHVYTTNVSAIALYEKFGN